MKIIFFKYLTNKIQPTKTIYSGNNKNNRHYPYLSEQKIEKIFRLF